MDELQFKTLDLEMKDSSAGTVTAKLGVVGGDTPDGDGDYSLPGFLGKQGVKMFWHHGMPFQNPLTIGKGTIQEDGKALRFDGKFNLKMPTAAEVYEQVKFDMEEGDPLQEWSYGYLVHPDGKAEPTKSSPEGTKRILKPRQDGTPGVLVKEVSPVALAGAGIGTQTLDVKSEGMTFQQQVDLTVQQVKALIERTVSLAELRLKEGKPLPQDKIQVLDQIKELVEEAGSDLRAPIDDLEHEYRRFLRLTSQLNGATL